MYPYDYNDLLQLHLNSDNSFDYDFDAHIAQYADVFGHDEKGYSDDHHALPIILSASDGFGSSDSSSSSRSPSVAESTTKAELTDDEIIVAGPSSSSSQPLMKGHERINSFDDSPAPRRPSPVPSGLSKTSRSKNPSTTRIPSIDPSGSKHPAVAELSVNRKRIRKSLACPAVLSDEDTDDENDNDTDDEYIPTPRSAGPKRRRMTSQLPACPSVPPDRNSSTSPAPIKRASGTSLSRNRQATSVTAIDRACNGNNINFVCPECGWKQANKRLPDFKRHLRTHTRPDETDQSKGWWCKGVPVEDAHKFDVPKDNKSYMFLGQERIGGCMQTFSRRDALKRHLDNANVACVGRPCEVSED